jgi:hypothetical protein
MRIEQAFYDYDPLSNQAELSQKLMRGMTFYFYILITHRERAANTFDHDDRYIGQASHR